MGSFEQPTRSSVLNMAVGLSFIVGYLVPWYSILWFLILIRGTWCYGSCSLTWFCLLTVVLFLVIFVPSSRLVTTCLTKGVTSIFGSMSTVKILQTNFKSRGALKLKTCGNLLRNTRSFCVRRF